MKTKIIKLTNCFEETLPFKVEIKPIVLIEFWSVAGDDVLRIFYQDRTLTTHDSDRHCRTWDTIDIERIFYTWEEFDKFIEEKGNKPLDEI